MRAPPTVGTSETRKLAAIMFTDMVGFSRLMHVDEEKTLQMLDEGNGVISEAVAEQQGRILKKMGDAVLADFSSAASAVTAAVQIQTRLRDYNEERPPTEHIVLRIGIHLGDMIIRDEDLFGDGINVAARLEPLSEPGGICMSEAVYQAIGSNSAIKPVLVGEVELKNIVQKQVIYRIPSFYGSTGEESPVPVGAGRSALDFGAVDRIEELPAPTRGPAAMAVAGVLFGWVSLAVGVSIALLLPPPFRIWDWEMLQPEAVVSALQERADPAHLEIWERMDRDTRDAITSFAADQASAPALRRTTGEVRMALNDLIEAGEPFAGAELDGPVRAGPPATPEDPRRLVRLQIESSFPGSIQRYGAEPTFGRRFRGVSSSALTLGEPFVAFIVIFSVLSALLSIYFASLETLRIFFDDIRDVDALLDYHVRDLGFHAPEKSGDELVFRATLWTFAVHSILKLKARVSGNSVVLTGPRPMMRRLRNRILAFARSGSG